MHAVNRFFSHTRARFVTGSFARNVLVMFTGTAIGQFGAVLLAPILTRIYSPEMFGVLGMFTALVSILSVVAALRYEMALPLAQTEEDATHLLAVCITALALTTCAAFLVLFVMDVSGITLGGLEPYHYLLPVGIFCIGAYHTLVYVATRKGAFHVIARTKIYQGGVGPVSQIAIGLASAATPLGLIIGFIFGQSAGIGLLTSRLEIREMLRGATREGMKRMATRFKRFPLFSSWSGLIEALGGTYLLLIAVPVLFSHAIAGFVFLTDRVIGRPLLLISTSILQVYVGDISRSLNGADAPAVRRRFLQLAGFQLVIVAGWLLLVNLLASPLFPIAFGQEWQAAVPYLHVLSIAYLPQMVMHALVHTLQVMERQKLSAAWESGRLVAVVSVFAVAHASGWDALHTLLIYSMVQAVMQIILFVMMYRSIQSLQKEHANA